VKQESECDVALSPGSTLLWIGYSTEGLLCSYDTSGVVRAFAPFYGNVWIPIYERKHE